MGGEGNEINKKKMGVRVAETQKNKNNLVPLFKKDNNKKSHQPRT